MTCIAIMGWPRTGKTTFATALAKRTGLPLISTGKRSEALDIYTKFFIDLEWADVPDVVRAELKKYPRGWILEGTQSARVIRSWYEDEPETLHLTRVHYFDNPPWVHREPGATAMGMGVATVFGRGKPSKRKPVLSYLRELNVEVVYGPDDGN